MFAKHHQGQSANSLQITISSLCSLEMKPALDIMSHICALKELKVNRIYEAVTNIENKCVCQ